MNVYELLIDRFTLDDLHDLTFRLGIDFEDLGGGSKRSQVRQLVIILQNRNREDDLIQLGERFRPDIDWKKLDWPQKTKAVDHAQLREITTKPDKQTSSEEPSLQLHVLEKLAPVGTKVLVLIFVLGFIAFGWYGYFRFFRQFSVAPALTPALLSFGESNAENVHYFQRGLDIPSELPWYTLDLEGRELVNSQNPSFAYDEMDAYLFFQPRLNTATSWAGIFFWHDTLIIPPRNLSRNSETIMVIHADDNDTVEITLKDIHGNEEKFAMPIVAGWAGYRIPFDETKSIDFNRLQLFEFAYARGVGSQDSNVFKIAQIAFR